LEEQLAPLLPKPLLLPQILLCFVRSIESDDKIKEFAHYLMNAANEKRISTKTLTSCHGYGGPLKHPNFFHIRNRSTQ
jgi:hypothetical protein